jgi:hypothetical protein
MDYPERIPGMIFPRGIRYVVQIADELASCVVHGDFLSKFGVQDVR